MNRLSITGLPVILSLSLAGVAGADPAAAPGLPAMPSDLPARCAELSHVPESAQIPGPQLAARISVANCMAEEAMNALALSPDAGSIHKLDAAVAPSLALLEAVIARGDPYWSVIAEDAMRDLYVGMVVRERRSIPGGNVAALAAFEPLLAPWRDAAAHASGRITELAEANPSLAKQDRVIGAVIAHADEERRITRSASLRR
ncbi:MAG TPA: hypothetical protein VFT22_36470 [Kofleriaceae bacterium]|nr:hypothetical protein [Kofleriaceae bacterium]